MIIAQAPRYQQQGFTLRVFLAPLLQKDVLLTSGGYGGTSTSLFSLHAL